MLDIESASLATPYLTLEIDTAERNRVFQDGTELTERNFNFLRRNGIGSNTAERNGIFGILERKKML